AAVGHRQKARTVRSFTFAACPTTLWLIAIIVGAPCPALFEARAQPVSLLGAWHETEVGSPARAGSLQYNAAAASHSYRVSGGGANMWFTNDAFHFVWKKVSGDVSLAADVSFPGSAGNPHRKACLIVRQDL